jgi:hypothetical protein
VTPKDEPPSETVMLDNPGAATSPSAAFSDQVDTERRRTSRRSNHLADFADYGYGECAESIFTNPTDRS